MTITVGPAGDAEVARRTDKQNKEVKSKNCITFSPKDQLTCSESFF